MSGEENTPFLQALLCGALAGTSVDVVLYPLDTVRTRLQSVEGFWKTGGFRGIYSGISAAFIGSAPSAGLFFSSYETCKDSIPSGSILDPINHSFSAALGEVAACLVRVPTENVKQKMQVGQFSTLKQTVNSITSEYGMRGFFRGYMTTVIRDSPFAMIQFPIWEGLKTCLATYRERDLNSFEASLCGAIAGGSTGCITCPLDVIKTRIMLGADSQGVVYNGFINTGSRIAKAEGTSALFKGVVPRTTMISLGGFVFLGGYDFYKKNSRTFFVAQEN